MKYKSSSRSQKQKSHRRKSRSHTKRRSSRRVQRGGLILTPSLLSNPSNSHVAGKGFTDTEGALTGCIGSPNSATALRGTNVDTIIGGVKSAVHMKGGTRLPERILGGRRRSCNMKGGVELLVQGGFSDPARGNPLTQDGGRRRSCNMKGGMERLLQGGSVYAAQDGGRRRSCNKRKCNHKNHRMQRGGSVHNTNGYSIGGVELKPSLSGIANNYHNAYDSCRG